MPVFRLNNDILFPPPELADPDGLLALGGDLSAKRLLAAYQQGIFPWYSEPDPILWWSPSPRLVLLPEQFHLPKRLARTIRQQRFQITSDTAFAETITACGALREQSGQGTWITPDMREAYVNLHKLGFAHSIECWQDGQLAGGLYGVQLDRMFFGESMFSRKRDASKVALATLVQNTDRLDIRAIDCQMTTNHLLSFGAQEMSRQEFQDILDQFIQSISSGHSWQIN